IPVFFQIPYRLIDPLPSIETSQELPSYRAPNSWYGPIRDKFPERGISPLLWHCLQEFPVHAPTDRGNPFVPRIADPQTNRPCCQNFQLRPGRIGRSHSTES